MNQKDKEQLELEINHIFESGANEIRIFNMVVDFIEKSYVEKNKSIEKDEIKEVLFETAKFSQTEGGVRMERLFEKEAEAVMKYLEDRINTFSNE
jgi:hypothetical protein